MSTLTANPTVEHLMVATRLDLDTLTRVLAWLTAEPDWTEDLVEAGAYRRVTDTFDADVIRLAGDYLLDERWWPPAIDRDQATWLVTTIVRTAGWADAI